MRYRLIALDLDGTLLTSRKEISPRTREALRAARERGVTLVIATGRSVPSALRFSRQIGGGPVVACNGAIVLDESGQVVSLRPIPQPLLLHALRLGKEAGCLAYYCTPRGLYLDQPLRYARTFLSWMRPRMPLGQALAALIRSWRDNRVRPVRDLIWWAEQRGGKTGADAGPAVLDLMLIGDPAVMSALRERLSREAPGLALTSSYDRSLEVMAGGVNKGSALELLGARLQIPRSAMLAFGDAENDVEMLRYAGLGVAMGNALPSVRESADRVTATCDEDGVAQVIEELCLK